SPYLSRDAAVSGGERRRHQDGRCRAEGAGAGAQGGVMAAGARGFVVAAVAVLAAGLALAPARAEPAGGYFLVPTGPVETVFDWSRDACVKSHVPDAPARAFRNADGEVRLIISHNDNRALLGPSLDAVVPSCAVVYEAGRSPSLA